MASVVIVTIQAMWLRLGGDDSKTQLAVALVKTNRWTQESDGGLPQDSCDALYVTIRRRVL